jgi:hypothetical protein
MGVYMERTLKNYAYPVEENPLCCSTPKYNSKTIEDDKDSELSELDEDGRMNLDIHFRNVQESCQSPSWIQNKSYLKETSLSEEFKDNTLYSCDSLSEASVF